MPFPNAVREEALVRSRRCCCVCHEFFGRAVEVHHIHQEADGGSNTLDNAIVLCDRCHAEAGHYNNHHPLGSKYSPGELRRHRDEWWTWCQEHPEAPLPKSPLLVSPGECLLCRGRWSSYPIVRVTNNSDRPLYSVTLIGSPSGLVGSSDFHFEPMDHTNDDPVALTGGLIVNAGHGVQFAYSDGDVCIVLPAVDPRQTLRLRVVHTTKADEGAFVSLKIRIASFAEKPEPWVGYR